MADEHRRSTDNLILEMHGILFELRAQLGEHMKWEEGEHQGINGKIKGLEERIQPLEETRRSLKAVWAGMATILLAVLGGAGLSVWYWLKSKIAPHLPIQ